jgi:hypothetical protein
MGQAVGKLRHLPEPAEAEIKVDGTPRAAGRGVVPTRVPERPRQAQ